MSRSPTRRNRHTPGRDPVRARDHVPGKHRARVREEIDGRELPDASTVNGTDIVEGERVSRRRPLTHQHGRETSQETTAPAYSWQLMGRDPRAATRKQERFR